jgi:hypothetical protein
LPAEPGTIAESGWLGTSYGVTLPVPFDSTAPASGPFEERLRGVVVREVREPEVFRLFFGHKLRRY